MLAAAHDAQTDGASRPTAGPVSQSPTADTQAATEIAPMTDRAIAALLDFLATMAGFAVIGTWAAVRWGGETSSGFNLTGTPAAVTILLSAIVGFLYYWVLEGTMGATLGKAVVAIRVRRQGGGHADLRASFVRNIWRIVDAFGVYLVGWIIAMSSKLRQRLGDHLAHTVVVRDNSSGRRGRMVGGVGLGVVFVGAIVLILAIRHGAAAQPVAASDSGTTPAPTSSQQSQEPSQAETQAAGATSTGSALRLTKVTFLDKEGGAERAPSPYTPGSDVYGTYELVGYAKAQDGHVDVAIRVNAVDPNGLSIAPPFPTNVRAAGPVNGPINGTFHVHLPEFVPAGTYTVRLLVHDNVAGSEAQFAPTYTVNAPPIAAATALELRNFRLSTSKGGDTVAHPVFHAGQTVYWSCEFAGIQFRSDQPEVHIDLALVGPDGSALINKTDWGTISQPFTYHPPTFFLVVDSYITLPSDAKAGIYAVRLRASDRVASATKTDDAHFEVQ